MTSPRLAEGSVAIPAITVAKIGEAVVELEFEEPLILEDPVEE